MARMQGRQCNEVWPSTRRCVLFKQQPDPRWLREILAKTNRRTRRPREESASDP